MTDPKASDAKAIAARLSKAQRDNFEGAWYGQRGWRLPRPSPPLHRLGLLEGATGMRLSPLGMAVRAELERTEP